MKYINNNNNQKIISFIENDINSYNKFKLVFEKDISRNFKVDKNITIVTNITDHNSILLKQLKNNNISYITINQDNYLDELQLIETDFILLILGKDAVIVGNINLPKYDLRIAGISTYVINHFIDFKFHYLKNAGINKFANPYCMIFNSNFIRSDNLIRLLDKVISAKLNYSYDCLNTEIYNPELFFKLTNFLELTSLVFKVDGNNKIFTTYFNNTELKYNDKNIEIIIKNDYDLI